MYELCDKFTAASKLLSTKSVLSEQAHRKLIESNFEEVIYKNNCSHL